MDTLDFVSGEIVNHDNIAIGQAQGQHRLDIDQDGTVTLIEKSQAE
jgi:hypothetical protein